MSVRQYDEQPFPNVPESYPGLEARQWVEVRRNDVGLPVGANGVILKTVPETGNYQVAVQVEGEERRRVVALCPDQVRPIDVPLPEPEPAAAAAAAAEKPAKASAWTEEKRAEQSLRVKEMWARKKAAGSAAAAEPAAAKRKLKTTPKPAPAPEPALMTRHRPPGMDAAIAAAVLGAPEPADEVLDPAVGSGAAFAEAMGQLLEYRESADAPKLRVTTHLHAVTWTRQAADAIRPVLAQAATGGANPVELALLVETISYLEDGGRP